MKKIFINEPVISLNDLIYIYDENYFHMSKVLRVKTGETFIIGDINNNEYNSEILDVDNKKITLKILSNYSRKKIIMPEVTIVFSILKSDKNEMIIQKCSEIGVTNFIPVITKNCIVKPDKNDTVKKITKWQKIAKEAGTQACLEKIPKINNIILFDELKIFDIKGIKLFCHIKEQNQTLINILKSNIDKKPVIIFVGPEGDFDKSEIDNLIKWGWEGINISPNILKSETACIYSAAGVFSYFWENNM